jgi:hypothetical protein
MGEPHLRLTFRAVSRGYELDRRRGPMYWIDGDKLDQHRAGADGAAVEER